MKRLVVFIFVVAWALVCSSEGFAWTDDVEGMLMPSPRGMDNMSDPDAVMANIEGSSDMDSENVNSAIEWE
jgi:hypothetical protein